MLATTDATVQKKPFIDTTHPASLGLVVDPVGILSMNKLVMDVRAFAPRSQVALLLELGLRRKIRRDRGQFRKGETGGIGGVDGKLQDMDVCTKPSPPKIDVFRRPRSPRQPSRWAMTAGR